MTQLTPTDLAKAAYQAYGASTGGQNFQGAPMPAWEDLGLKRQLAWIAAVSIVYTLSSESREPGPDGTDAGNVPGRVVPDVPKKGWNGLRD